MLWITGTILLAAWFVGKFIFGKGGMIHVVLMMALSFFLIQLVQDRRTKAYFREQDSDDR